MTERFDAIIIGTGQAGPPFAVRLAASSRKTAILESKRIGGTCVNVGCIPTKTLIASARRGARRAALAADFGVVIDGHDQRRHGPRSRRARTRSWASPIAASPTGSAMRPASR